MVGKLDHLRKICKEIEKVKNFAWAVEHEEMCELHHLKEDDGTTATQLIERGEYYDVSPDEVIFLTKSEHATRHGKIQNGKFLKPKYGTENNAYKHVDFDELYDLRVNQRMTLLKIGKILGLTRHTVAKKIIELGIENVKCERSPVKEETKQKISASRFKSDNPNWCNVDMEALRDMYNSGELIESIAEKLNCSTTTIRRRLRSVGLYRYRKAEH